MVCDLFGTWILTLSWSSTQQVMSPWIKADAKLAEQMVQTFTNQVALIQKSFSGECNGFRSLIVIGLLYPVHKS